MPAEGSPVLAQGSVEVQGLIAVVDLTVHCMLSGEGEGEGERVSESERVSE